MVGCEGCDNWFHPECVGQTEQEVSKLSVSIDANLINDVLRLDFV